MELHILKIILVLWTIGMLVLSGLVNSCETFLPVFIKDSFRYGKFSYYGKPSTLKVFKVPKRWFRHFYVTACIAFSFGVIWAIRVYLFNHVPSSVSKLLDIVATSDRKANVTSTASLIALLLMCLQTWRRLYETYCVSVFSNSLMNVSHYMLGIFHYIVLVLVILAEAPGFTNPSYEYKVGFSLSDINWLIATGVFIFAWAWYNQFVHTSILANLRKSKAGSVVSLKHSLPRGDLFEYVSAPHMLCEVLMYFGITLVLFGNSIWVYVFIWVLSNQMECAMLNHWWYLSEFRDYPKERRAFIPFVL